MYKLKPTKCLKLNFTFKKIHTQSRYISVKYKST